MTLPRQISGPNNLLAVFPLYNADALGYGAVRTSGEGPRDFSLAWLKGALRRNRLLSAAVFLFVFAAAAVPLYLVVKPTYEPLGTVIIEPPGAETFSLETAAPSESDAYLTTQAAILKSDALALQVIRQLHLDHNPEFIGAAAIRSFGNGDQAGTDAVPSPPEDIALSNFQRHLNVELYRNSRLIEVRFASHNPVLAAQVTNALMSVFVEQNYKSRYADITQSSEWLTRQLEDIREKATQSSRALAAYESRIGFLDVDQKQDTLAQKIGELTHELNDAKASRVELAAYLEALRQGDIDAVPELRDSELFHQTTEGYLQARAQLAEQSAIYGSNNPRVKRLEAQSQQLRTGLMQSVQASYVTAVARETKMAHELQQLQGPINLQNQAMVQLNELKREASANAELYNTLFAKVREAGIAAASKSTNVRILDYAKVLRQPSRPNRPLYLAIAGVLGILASLILVVTKETFDDTIRSEDEVRQLTALPVVGLIPKLSPAVRNRILRVSGFKTADNALRFAAERPDSMESEAIHNLRTHILLSGKKPKRILVTSSRAQEGKTVVAANLAITLASYGKTCLVDADLRRPSLGRIFGASDSKGLSQVLDGQSDGRMSTRPSGIADLDIVPAGACVSDVVDLISSRRMEKVLDALSAEYDYVVIDSAPVLPFSDARILSVLADGVVVVGRYGVTTQDALLRSTRLLNSLNANILGVVLNGVEQMALPYYRDYYLHSATQ